MSGGGSDAPLPGSSGGGEFLLSLLQRANHLQHLTSSQPPPPPQQQQPLTLDPAVAAVGPAFPFPLHRAPHDGHDPSPPWPNVLSPPRPPLSYPHSYVGPTDDFGRLGLRFGADSRVAASPGAQNLRFGAFPLEAEPSDHLPKGNSIESPSFNSVKEREVGSGSRSYDRFDRNRKFNGRESLNYSNSSSNSDAFRHRNFDSRKFEQSGIGRGKPQLGSNIDSSMPAPPGFQREVGDRGFADRRRFGFEHDAGEVNGNFRDLNHRNNLSMGDGNMRPREFHSDGERRVRSDRVLVGQFDPDFRSVHTNLVDKSIRDMNHKTPGVGSRGEDACEIDDLDEQLVDSLLLEDMLDENENQKLLSVVREKVILPFATPVSGVHMNIFCCCSL